MLTAAIMFLLLVVAVWTDLDSHKIYNGNTYTGIALALLIATVNSYWGGGEQMQRLLGSIQLGDAAVGFFYLRIDHDRLLRVFQYRWR
jgi:hypothetical protein